MTNLLTSDDDDDDDDIVARRLDGSCVNVQYGSVSTDSWHVLLRRPTKLWTSSKCQSSFSDMCVCVEDVKANAVSGQR